MPSEPTQFAVLLFTDICDSTALKARHGALEYKVAAEAHNALFERIAEEEKLTLIKNTGDGYFARTTSVAAAVRFALRFQHGMRAMGWPSFPLTTRVGIHAGEVADITTLGQADVLAPAADLVARVMSLAVGGQILLTRWPFDEARHFVRAHPAVESGELPALTWLAHGPYLFKGCEEPVEVFEVGAENLAPLVAPPDGEKAKRTVRPGDEETLGWRPAVGLEVPGRTDWVLARKIGEGGFGEVWLAEQAAMKQRRVFKFCFDEERLRSFKRELTFFRLIRDALGERGDIARLYDVKLDTPPFYLESEFAEHGNLVEWSEKQGGIGAVPLERRLEIVARVAEAVAAAHSVGVLHKDLKPQNVLMQGRADSEAVPQITDFGIGILADKSALAAHAITAAGFTMNTLVSNAGGSSMTRLYAPPEQLTGKRYTMQGDVYALGVMLYQMVIGDFTRALAPGWEREVQDELLREDLAECLDGEPARRMASVAELAERLRSLEARRSARAIEQQRQQRYARRKRRARLAVVGAAVAAVVAFGLGVGFFRERGLRQRTDAAEKLAKSRLDNAEKARDAAEDLINEAVYGLRKKLAALGKVDVMEDMVVAADDYYRRLPPELFDDEARMHLVSLALNRANIAAALGQDVAGEEYIREALRLGEELAVRHPDREKLQEELCFAQLTLCQLLEDRNESAALLPNAEKVVARCDAALKAKPDALWAMRYAALAHSMAGHALTRYLDRKLEGFARFQTASQLALRMREVGGETAEVCEVEGFVHYGNAKVAERLNQQDRMIGEYEASMSSFARALELGGDSALLREMHLGAMHHFGNYLRMKAVAAHDEEGALRGEEIVRQAFEGRRKLVELEPGRAEWWRDLAHSYLVLGFAAADRKDFAIAIQQGRESLRCREEAIKRQPNRPLLYDERGISSRDLGAWLLASTPPDTVQGVELTLRSIEDWRRGIEMSKYTMFNRSISWEVGCLVSLAAVGKAGAPEWLRRAREIIEPLLNKTTAEHSVAGSYITLVRCQVETLTKLGRTKDAASASAALDQFKDTPDFLRVEVRERQGRTWKLLDRLWDPPVAEKGARFEEMKAHVQSLLTILEKHPDLLPNRDRLEIHGDTLHVLGTALFLHGDLVEAETALREATAKKTAAIATVSLPNEVAEHRIYAGQSQLKYGDVICKQGRLEEGRKLAREAVESIDQNTQLIPHHNNYNRLNAVWREYASVCEEKERFAIFQKAAEYARQALKLMADAKQATDEEQNSVRQDSGWAFLEYGWRLRDAGELAAAESALREGIACTTENLAHAPIERLPERAALTGHLHYDLAHTLYTAKRPDEAQQETERLAELIPQVEKAAGPDHPDAIQLRAWLKSLRER